MSIKARNIVAIVVAAVAVAAVVAVIVLASITIKPTAYSGSSHAGGWLTDYSSVEIYYSGQRMPGENAEGKLTGNGADSGKYGYSDVLDTMNFPLFSACLQFNYDFGLRLADKSHVKKNQLTLTELKAEVAKITDGTAAGYSFVIKFDGARTLDLKDGDGRQASLGRDEQGNYILPSYDTVIFTVTEDSDWARQLTAYAYLASDLDRQSDAPGETAGTYYRLGFGAKTSALVNMLDDIYDPSEPPAEDEGGEEGGEEGGNSDTDA